MFCKHPTDDADVQNKREARPDGGKFRAAIARRWQGVGGQPDDAGRQDDNCDRNQPDGEGQRFAGRSHNLPIPPEPTPGEGLMNIFYAN